MKNIASLFSEEARDELKRRCGIELSDRQDYSEEELAELFERITDDFPYEFDDAGEPMHLGRVFEDIVDVFVKNKLIAFNY